ncbi:MAG: InlB B-repeat-containing protein [Oscillospiraceae bacterium]|jgi:uncharacterized repeat protein (TIGR02543 family)|nr:InlB B-repeat-containing protein [Oscillospiraceae bacterium]
MTPSVTVPLTFTVALPPSAAIGDVTISGTVGSIFVDQQTATITLVNDTLKDQMQDVDAKAWAASFTASGLNVRAVGAKDGNQIELQFSGRPPVAYAGAFGSITIPGTYLTSGKDLLITENASATFAIAEETRGAPSATISDVVIRGSIYGNVDATATVTLENDVMAYGAEDMPLNGWFYDLPRGVNAFASFSAQGNTITLKFAGRVGEVSAAHFGEGGGIALEIKAAALARGQEITVSPNPNAKFIITGAEGGITATPNSLDFGSAPLGYQALSAAKMVTITNLGTDSIPLDFIRLQSSTSNFSFTPTELPSPLNSGESIQITVQPVDGLTLGNHTNTLGIQYRQGAIGPKTLEIPLTFTVENTAPQPKNPVPTQYIYVPNSSDTVGHTAFVYASEIAFGSDDIEIVSVNTGSSSKVTGSVENGRAVLSSVALGEQQVSVTVQNSKGETQISVPVVVLLQPRDVLVIGGIASKSDDVPPGEVVTVLANASEQGKRFTGFTADLESLAFSKRSHYEYSFVMPEQNVTITANYETWNLTEGVEYTLPTGGTKDAEGNIDWVGRETILINRVEGYQITNRLDMGFADQVGSMSQSTIDGREVTLYAQNTASGEISAAKTLTFYQDLTAPATPTLAGARGHSIWEINPVTLTVSASDALSGIASFEYTLDAEGSWSAPIPWNAEGDNTFTISDSGSYANSIHVRVSDAAGNTATSGFYTVQLNTEPLVGDFSIGINPETGDLTAKRTTGLWHNWSGEGVINSRTDTLLREAYTLGETITLTLTDPYTHQGAQINVVVYTVTFDGNGNGGSSMVYCFKDLAVAQPDNPARTGHTFKGWSTDATVYSAYDFDTPITAATTLYAHWTLNTYKIFFELNGGSWEVPYPTEYTYGTGMYFFPAPVKDDHYFDGWFAKDGTSTSNWGSLVTSIGETDLGDKTVYAKWTERTYTAAISVMKDDLAWHQSNSGKAFTLIHDSSKAEYNMEARKGLYVYEAVVPNGTYSVFNGSVDTGVDITIYRASNDATINYYTITFGATPAGVATTGASITTATYGGAPIDSNTVVLSGEELILIVTPSGADGYAYLWSGAGVPADQKAATLTIGNLSGTVNATCTVTGGDSTAPTGSISIGGNSWTAASTFIPYELFYKEAVTVTIAATDNIDEEVKVEYRIVEKSGAISNWITYSAPFTIDVGSTAYILARFTDDSGNETRINSSGVVVYEDAQQDTEAIAFTKFSLADVSASVMLNGNTIAGITNGEETLVPGEDYTVSGGIITFKASYLDSLVASDEPYTLTIAYNPRGEAYVDTEGNDAPATTTIALDVLRYGIAPPVANQPLTENGEVQVGVPTGMGYDVWGGRGSEPGTYMAVVELNQNYQWLDGTTRRLSITWEILEKKEPAKNTRVLVSPFVPANDPDFMDFMGQRTKTRDTALLYEAKLVDTRTLAEFKLPIGQTFLLKLIHPQTDEAMHVLLRENKDGTFDCVLVNVDIKEIKYPITDFTRYGIAPDEEYIEGVEPHSDMELNGWVYWVWTLDAEELVLRIEN